MKASRRRRALVFVHLLLAALVPATLGVLSLSASAPAFHQAETVDDFNRPDESPLSDGGKWTQWGNQLSVASNQLRCTQTGSECHAWRNDVRYGLDQEAWVTFATKPSSWVRLYARVQKPTVLDGYAVRFQTNTGTDQVFLERVTNGSYTTLATFSEEFQQGDKLRIRAEGSTISAFRYTSGAWGLVGEASDSTYIGVGYVGVGIRVNVARLDDFGAATLRDAVPYSDETIDDFNRPDESPLSDGGKWTQWGNQLSVASNQLRCTQTGSECHAWRNDVRYGLDQEAWVTFATKSLFR